MSSYNSCCIHAQISKAIDVITCSKVVLPCVEFLCAKLNSVLIADAEQLYWGSFLSCLNGIHCTTQCDSNQFIHTVRVLCIPYTLYTVWHHTIVHIYLQWWSLWYHPKPLYYFTKPIKPIIGGNQNLIDDIEG